MSDMTSMSQMEEVLRKFSKTHKVECNSTKLEIPRVHRSIKEFPTGSKYDGTWNLLGMSGRGVYTFPNGVVYEGEFDDGMFHGRGQLAYPCGAVLKGRWHKGELVERKLVFEDGLQYKESDWQYCRIPDRRFTIEYKKGLQAAGASFMTANQPTVEVPQGYYDTGDGYYDPGTKVVYKYNDLTAIIRSPSQREQSWIVENCRTNPIAVNGPRQDLYEEWSQPLEGPLATPDPLDSSIEPDVTPQTKDKDLDDYESSFTSVETSSDDYTSDSVSLSRYC